MSSASQYHLAFEAPIAKLEEHLAELEALHSKGRSATSHPPGTLPLDETIRRMRRELVSAKRDIYANLDPWQTVQVSRHPRRPHTRDYLDLVFDRFLELNGDRAIGNDMAMVTGLAHLGDRKVMVVGHQKGKNLAERKECNFGCAHPEGYRKALLKMRLAAKFKLPVVCLIDTPGAYPGIGAEERGQAAIIAENLMAMSRIDTPIVCVVIGEGGSGGALGIGIGDKIAMMEHAYYSVISPEGCAGILWKTANDETKPRAAHALRMTATDLQNVGVLDDVIPEPVGGAHRSPREMAATMKAHLTRHLRELTGQTTSALLNARYAKFRAMGIYR